MKIGNTPTGESININGSPFDMAEIIIPEINFVYNITDDLASGSSLTMQRASNKSAVTIDWNGGYHDEDTNRRDGTGSMTVVKDSYSEKLLLYIFNELDNNKAKILFDVHYWNAEDTNIQAKAINCTLQNVAPVKLSNGSTNDTNAEQWTFNAQLVKRGNDNPNDNVINQIKSVEAQKSNAYTPDITSENISEEDSLINAGEANAYAPDIASEDISEVNSLINAGKSNAYTPNVTSENISEADSLINAGKSGEYTPNMTSEDISEADSLINAGKFSETNSLINAGKFSEADSLIYRKSNATYPNPGSKAISQEQSWAKEWVSSASQKLASHPGDSELSEEISEEKEWFSQTKSNSDS